MDISNKTNMKDVNTPFTQKERKCRVSKRRIVYIAAATLTSLGTLVGMHYAYWESQREITQLTFPPTVPPDLAFTATKGGASFALGLASLPVQGLFLLYHASRMITDCLGVSCSESKKEKDAQLTNVISES